LGERKEKNMASEVEHEPESQSAAEESDFERARRPGKVGAPKEKPHKVVSCEHPGPDLADGHCRDCGAELHPVPVAGIERLIDERLRELGVIGPDGRLALAGADAKRSGVTTEPRRKNFLEIE